MSLRGAQRRSNLDAAGRQTRNRRAAGRRQHVSPYILRMTKSMMAGTPLRAALAAPASPRAPE
jgi:hypothetical protein